MGDKVSTLDATALLSAYFNVPEVQCGARARGAAIDLLLMIAASECGFRSLADKLRHPDHWSEYPR